MRSPGSPCERWRVPWGAPAQLQWGIFPGMVSVGDTFPRWLQQEWLISLNRREKKPPCFVPMKKNNQPNSETRLWEQAALLSQKPTHVVQEAAEARFPAGFSTDVKEDALILQPKLEHEHAPGADTNHQHAPMTFGHPLPRVVPSPGWTLQGWMDSVCSHHHRQIPQGFKTPWTGKGSPRCSHFFPLPKQFKENRDPPCEM